MPDHAGALARKTGGAAEVGLQRQQEEIQPNINFFNDAINKFFASGRSLRTAFCSTQGSDPLSNQFKRFCSDGYVQINDKSNLNIEYAAYLDNLKNEFIYQDLASFNSIYKNIGSNKKRLKQIKQALQDQQPKSENINKNMRDAMFALFSTTASIDTAVVDDEAKSSSASPDLLWAKSKSANAIGAFFSPVNFTTAGDAIANFKKLASSYAASGSFETKKKILEDLEKQLSKKNVEDIPPDCEPPPLRLASLISPRVVNTAASSLIPVDACQSNNIRLGYAFSDAGFEEKRGSLLELFSAIPYFPKKSDFNLNDKIKLFDINNDGKRTAIKVKVALAKNQKTNIDKIVHNVYESYDTDPQPSRAKIHARYSISSFNYKQRVPAGGSRTQKAGPKVWSCLTRKISLAWDRACEVSGYVPFQVTRGIIGHHEEPQEDDIPLVYEKGIDPLAYGLGFELDPFLKDRARPPHLMQHSIWTGAWSPLIVSSRSNYDKLYELGIFGITHARAKRNLIDFDNLQAAFSYKEKENEVLPKLAGEPICRLQANPTLWIITFCEASGFVWCNSNFLKTSYSSRTKKRTRRIYTEKEKSTISSIYGIPNVVDRIRAISWSPRNTFNRRDNHCRLQFYNPQNSTLIGFDDIDIYKTVLQ